MKQSSSWQANSHSADAPFWSPRFNTAFTRTRHWTLPEPNESSPHISCLFKTHFNIILQPTPTSPNVIFPSGIELKWRM
jgi:hypothetical protein